MSYKVVVDSCGELTEEMKQSEHFVTASLEIEVDGYHIIDDATFDQKDFFKKSCSGSGVSEVLLPITGTLYGDVSL